MVERRGYTCQELCRWIVSTTITIVFINIIILTFLFYHLPIPSLNANESNLSTRKAYFWHDWFNSIQQPVLLQFISTVFPRKGGGSHLKVSIRVEALIRGGGRSFKNQRFRGWGGGGGGSFEFLDKWRKYKTYDEPKEKGCNEHMIWRKKKLNQRSSFFLVTFLIRPCYSTYPHMALGTQGRMGIGWPT